MRVEFVLAVARVFLSAVALVGNWLASGEPSAFSATARWVLIAYGAYSILLLVGVKLTGKVTTSHRAPFVIHGIDLVWPAVVGFLTQGPNSPFFVLLMFAVVAAGYRWGFRAALGTSSVTLLLFSLKGGLSYGQEHGGLSAETESDLIRTAYLLAMGFLIANLAENEKRTQAEISAVARTLGKVRAQRGLRSNLQSALDELLDIFEAEKILIVVEEERSKRLYAWEGSQGEEAQDPVTNITELDPRTRGTYLFPLAANAFYVARQKSGGSVSVVAIDANGDSVPCTFNDILEQFPWQGSETLMAASFAMANEWCGRLFLFNTATGRKKQELRFLQTLVRQLMPALYGAYALGRVRSRAGAIERLRVARELHDGAIQSLIGTEMYVDSLRRRVPDGTDGIREDLQRIQDLLRNEVINLRELMQQLKPLDLDSREFTGYLVDLIERFRKESGRSIGFVTDIEEVDLPPFILYELAKIVQEALVNIRKHSRADNVVVQLSCDTDTYKLSVEDDGQGFEWTGQLSLEALQKSGKGPMIIKERVRGIGGDLSIDSRPGQGTRIVVSVPRKTKAADGTFFESYPYPDR